MAASASANFCHKPWNPSLDTPPRISVTPDQLARCTEAMASFRQKTPEMIRQEYDHLKASLDLIEEKELAGRCTVALNDANLKKNRYPENILPFDENRVVLESSTDARPMAMGFINIAPSESVSQFIATQGPLQHTCEDFWEMVIQFHCPVIVNLTRLFEYEKKTGKDKEKCFDYFQAEEGPKTFGNISIVCEWMKTTKESLVLRYLKVQRKEDPPLYVLHIHYPDWPDHGVPEETNAVRAIFKRLYCLPPKCGPIVVHCSAGIGRTGTYCAVHNTIQRILAGYKSAWDLHNTICVFRSQRYAMAREKDQYFFCYKAIAEELKDLVSHQQ
ncbi:protein-tyrosine-phosphatase PTP1-like isoform X2 [Prosopis cineraria]|uniref:protein-tyrosine-phosphatase PTP1-like isoform X2 n=1 Tax=Prosopis cineraria TaxID=364024 RepID=UPI0024108ECE|nr:protein-tyrosine-phosphatase PTP1-like isoform X2 [Prosopis cineraria]